MEDTFDARFNARYRATSDPAFDDTQNKLAMPAMVRDTMYRWH